MTDSVLIVSNSSDVHSDYLVNACRKVGVNCFRYNTDHFRLSGKLAYSPLSHNGVLCLESRTVEISKFNLIVYRRPIAVAPLRHDIEPWVATLLDHEWNAFELALSSHPKATILNPVEGSANARNKLVQVQRAHALGLNVPETLVSNSLVDLRNFMSSHDCISKAIQVPSVKHNELWHCGFTVGVNLEDFYTADEKIPITLLQRKVTPEAVWRIVTVGGKFIGFRYSGDVLRTAADSRSVEKDAYGEIRKVPDDVQSGLKKLCASFPINFASSDFIEDADGRLWFIDLNPDGQWAYLEDRYGYKISDAIIGLAKHS